MKTTNKTTHNTNKKTTNKVTNKTTNKTSNCRGCKNSMESSDDPDGSYTGNPVGQGKYAEPVQDADDL